MRSVHVTQAAHCKPNISRLEYNGAKSAPFVVGRSYGDCYAGRRGIVLIMLLLDPESSPPHLALLTHGDYGALPFFPG